jgi:hypothetical protein
MSIPGIPERPCCEETNPPTEGGTTMRFMIIVKATRDSEVRQLFELEDFRPSEAIERFRAMGMGTGK